MSNEFNTTEQLVSTRTLLQRMKVLVRGLMRDAFGLNPNVAEAKATLMVKDNEGNASFTIIDFNRTRDVQVQMSTRSINSNVYGQLANSFDRKWLVSSIPRKLKNNHDYQWRPRIPCPTLADIEVDRETGTLEEMKAVFVENVTNAIDGVTG